MNVLRKILPLLLLLSICLGAVACTSPEQKVAYDKEKAMTAIADMRTHIREKKGVGKGLTMLAENEAVQVFTFLQKPDSTDVAEGEETLYLSVVTISSDRRYSFRLDILLDKDNPEKAVRRFENRTVGYQLAYVEDVLDIPTYTGAEFMSFDKAVYPENETKRENETIASVPTEQFLKETSRNMLNLAVITLDAYMAKTIRHDRMDFGFVAYDEKNNPTGSTQVACLPTPADRHTWTLSAAPGIPADIAELAVGTPAETAEDMCTCEAQVHQPYCPVCGKKTALFDQFWNCTCGAADNIAGFCPHCGEARPVAETDPVVETEDLGPAFSPARISYALRMTLLGMGMVFAVLALLWLVLAIFKSIFGGKSAKQPKAPKESKRKPESVAPEAPASAVIPAGTDPATVAAITAAIAAMIESDPALSEQFAGGFRVVSFRKKSGKTSWNH